MIAAKGYKSTRVPFANPGIALEKKIRPNGAFQKETKCQASESRLSPALTRLTPPTGHSHGPSWLSPVVGAKRVSNVAWTASCVGCALDGAGGSRSHPSDIQASPWSAATGPSSFPRLHIEPGRVFLRRHLFQCESPDPIGMGTCSGTPSFLILWSQILLSKSSSDIITVLYIACAELWEGPIRLHPLQAACRKPQEEEETNQSPCSSRE